MANKMAKMVYEELQALAKKCCKCPNKADDWATIKDTVDRFNRHKPAKAPWTRWGEMSESDFEDKVDILFPPLPYTPQQLYWNLKMQQSMLMQTQNGMHVPM